MKKETIAFSFGIFAFILAYIPFFPEVMPLLGIISGIIGVFLIIKVTKERKSKKGFDIFAILVCIFGTTASVLMLLYSNISLSPTF